MRIHHKSLEIFHFPLKEFQRILTRWMHFDESDFLLLE
jgi:hypothetical protein